MAENLSTGPDRHGAPRRRAGIQSVEIGLNALDALAALGRAAPLSAVAKRCGLSPSQTHRYLASLIVSEMAWQDGSGHYELGPGALRLGLAALSRADVYRDTDAAIGGFVAAAGRTVQIAAFRPIGPTIVRWHVGTPPVVTLLSVGSVLPMLTATMLSNGAFDPASDDEAAAGLHAACAAVTRGIGRRAPSSA